MNIKTLKTTTAIILLSLLNFANANIITVDATNGAVTDDSFCSISEAIINANDDAATNSDCSAGNGTDTIELTAGVILNEAQDYSLGVTGTPPITSNIILDGQSFILQRDTSVTCELNGTVITGEFRILRNTSTGDLTLQNITIANGCADGADSKEEGGGLYNDGTLILSNVTFVANSAEFLGGAIKNNGKITNIQNSTFSDNSANFGGAISNDSEEITTIQNSTFSANSAGIEGGAIFNFKTITTIENSTFSANSAGTKGGAIFNDVLGAITTIENSTFSANSAGSDGGAILNSNSITIIQNSTFSANSVGSDGGAIFNYDGEITTIQNSTFSDNSARSNGGAIYNSNGVTTILRNSLFNNNGSGECVNFNSYDGKNNISTQISTDSGCPGLITAVLTSDTIGPLADNGGATFTHALLAGSEAIDAGDMNSTTSDQRGFAADGIRDIGTFEAQIPRVTAPADITTEATGATTAVTLGTASVTDVDETGLTATADMASPFAVGMFTITWSATDSYGFMGTDTQTVNVQAVISGTVSGLNGSLTLQNNAADDLTLNADGSFRFAIALDNLSTYAITVSAQPATQTCSISNATGQINGSNVTDITVNCVENTLTIDSNSLDYGAVFTNETGTRTVTLTNSGTGDVIISTFTSPAAPFSIVSGSCMAIPVTLLPTETCDFTITFSPASEGSFSSSFAVTSNTTASPTIINLAGSSAIRIIPTLSFYGLMLMIFALLIVGGYRCQMSDVR